jgi:outer membrane protein assembly factor BamB
MRRFAKLNAADGYAEWETQVGGSNSDWISSYGSPAVQGKRVIMSGRFSRGDSLAALNTEDGAKAWGHPASGGTLGSATIAGERVLFATSNSTLYCLNLEDGKELWTSRLGSGGSDASWSATTPAVELTGPDEGIAVAGSGDGRMSGIRLSDGKVLWTHESDSSVFKVSPYRRDSRPLLSSPTIAGDQVFFGSADGTVYGLDLETGKQLWSFVIGVPVMSTPLVSGNALYVAAYDGRLYAFTSQGESRP